MKNQQSRALAAPLPFRTPRILSTAAALRSVFFLCTLHSIAALAAPGQTSHPAEEREADRSPAPIEITVDLNDFEEIDADTLGATPHVFRGAGSVYLDGKLAAGTTAFRDASILDLAPGSSITAGEQYFRDTSTLITPWNTKIYGGQQVFTDRSTFSAADEILGGQQFFHDESTLSLGRSHVIMGGEQRFMDKSCLTATSQNPIKKGIQTFHDDSRVNASQRRMLDGGTQFFLDRSTLDINVPGALSRNNAVFKDQSKIHLNVEQGIEPGTSIALSDSAGMHMFGHSVDVDTVESLDFHAQAFVQNGGDTDAVLTVNPRDIRQPFFNGHMRDGGAGKLGLIKEGPRTFYLAGEQAIAYSGDTEVKDGVLAIRGVAPGASHKTVLLNGGWLDISELPAESADQFELKGSYPAKVLRLADDDRRTVAAGQHETLDTPLGSGDTEDQGKYLVKTGPGKLTLDAENHYIGATRVQEGILSFSKNEQLGQEAVVRSLVLEGGSLELTADLHTDRTMELRTTAVVDTEATSSNWRSALQDAQPRTLIKQGSGALTFREESHLGSVKVEDGSISFLDTPKITAAAGEPAVAMGATAKSASFAGGLIKSINAPAITAHAGDSRVDLLRMQAMAQDAPLAQAQGSAKLEIDANATQSSGSLAARENAGMRFTLTQGSRWTGAAEVRDNSQIHVAIADSTSRWNVTDNSVVTTLANAGTLQFGNAGPASGGAQASSPAFPALPTSPTDYACLHVRGDYAGGGAIRMRTKVDGDQVLTDRLLIEGDASGETKLDVALEISGKQHKLSSVSLVQVGGNANADSFKLAQGEIMLKGSPFKHVLDAYGPAEMAAKPGRAPDWMLDKNPTWDFRLQIAKEDTLGFIVPPIPKVNPEGDTQDAKPDAGNGEAKPPVEKEAEKLPAIADESARTPETTSPLAPQEPAALQEPATQPDPGTRAPAPKPAPPAPKPPKTRAKLVPQASAYLAAPRALQNYQAEITGTLHQQLRDDRERATTAPERAYNGYARIIGLSHTYRSNLAWASHGIDFGQKSQALQVGGTLLRKQVNGHTVTLGAAATLGSTSIDTHGLPAERANARFDMRDVALTAGIGHRGGFYVDGIVAIGSFDGKVRAGSRHPSARPHGRTATLSLAAGKTLRFDNGMILQPQLQWQYNRISFASTTDKNKIDIRVGTSDSHTLRAGVNFSWPQAGGAWTSYAQAHLLTGWGGAPTVRLSGNAFDTGRAGQAAELTLGARAELGKSTSLHGAVSGRTRLGQAGTSGVAGTLGVRYVF